MAQDMEELIDSSIEGLLQDDSYYNLYATPLKPASAIKQEHRKQLKELFQLKELRLQLDKAQNVILDFLPTSIPPEEFAKIKGELDGSGEHFVNFVESMSGEKTILLQEMFGLSDQTLVHIYGLAVDLLGKGKVEEAHALFVFLGTMAPHVESYWVAQGICLRTLNRHEEAIAVFEAAKILNPKDPVPSNNIIESFLSLKEQDKAKQELEALKLIVETLEGEEKGQWERRLNKHLT